MHITSNSRFFIVIILVQLKLYLCVMYLENMYCNTYDKNFSRFDACEIRWLQPKVPSATLKIHLLQLPVTNCDFHMELIFLTSKFAPPLLNSTWNGCAFLKNHKRGRAFLWLYNWIKNNTNLNHSCPYNHDIHVIDVNAGSIPLPIPLPHGEYLLKTHYLVDNKLRLGVDLKIKL